MEIISETRYTIKGVWANERFFCIPKWCVWIGRVDAGIRTPEVSRAYSTIRSITTDSSGINFAVDFRGNETRSSFWRDLHYAGNSPRVRGVNTDYQKLLYNGVRTFGVNNVCPCWSVYRRVNAWRTRRMWDRIVFCHP